MVEERPDIGVREQTLGGVTLVEISGELDILAASGLAPRMDALTGAERLDLILDLRQVTFMDCAGVSVLCRARNRVLAGGGRLRLVIGDSRVRDLLRVVRLDGAFEVLEDLASAA
ncbi:STAS domain-containing protein [Streptomyces sp. SAJ15]|uniref:STAS domain-containing protein n=1 Tax=Streptomyces sp. SAJ15 TaxID=2011095 RepID=UPI001185CC3D|nr:STAS domain-containing protein [Streptomyces sp. SAJ15]TVL94076.1 sulfate transporter [Streptomyces sp. SAJ15]